MIMVILYPELRKHEFLGGRILILEPMPREGAGPVTAGASLTLREAHGRREGAWTLPTALVLKR